MLSKKDSQSPEVNDMTETKATPPVEIVPTIGRVVWFKDSTRSKQPLQANVCFVQEKNHNGEYTVVLGGFDHRGRTYAAVATLFQGSWEDCPEGSCCWMPYQQAQAAKEKAAT